jgi:membrane protein implicated in regulation of membrane protease activity
VVAAIAAVGFVTFAAVSAIVIGLGHRWRGQYKAQRRGQE